jgi:hypothetical protein
MTGKGAYCRARGGVPESSRLSAEPVSTFDPSGEITAFMGLPVCPENVRTREPVATSQSFAVKSCAPVTIRAPSEEKPTEVIEPACPEKVRISTPVVSQSLTLPSADPVKNVVWSTENFAHINLPVPICLTGAEAVSPAQIAVWAKRIHIARVPVIRKKRKKCFHSAPFVAVSVLM